MEKEIIIIDDDSIFRMIVSKTINKIDTSVIISECENGEIGLAKLESLTNSNHKIIVFLDINMPILDGWGFLDEIEKRNFYNLPQLLIYMVSSSIDINDILRAKQYEFIKGFFHKPLKRNEIKAIIEID